MQRRGGGKRDETHDDDRDDLVLHRHRRNRPSALPSSPATAAAVRVTAGGGGGGQQSRRASGSGFGVPFRMFVVLLVTLSTVEYAAYTMLDVVVIAPPPPLASPAVVVVPEREGRRAEEEEGKVGVGVLPAGGGDHDAMTDHDMHDQMTYEPTHRRRAMRLREYRSAHEKYAKFWKYRVPDAVPPLPPDIDTHTGERLPPVIAYVTTLTGCSGKYGGLDGAAVLLHSIRRNSYGWMPVSRQLTDVTHSPRYGGEGGRYRHRAYVLVDPRASPEIGGPNGECARYLRNIGYTILHRPSLVPLFKVKDDDDIDGKDDGEISQFYREWSGMGYVGRDRPLDGPTARQQWEHPDKLAMLMSEDGCCGYTELLKLHVYGMVEHVLAVHLDFDSMLLRPMDDLFDVMLGKDASVPIANLPLTRYVNFSRPIDAAFTRDYNSVKSPGIGAPVGYQGGFLVVRPDLEVLERYRTILRRGEFVVGTNGRRHGWGAKHGGFYGDVTFQGILPYYYEDVAPPGMHNEVELDRCVYNQMGDNPRKSTYKFPRATPLDPEKMGFRDTSICRDGRTDCSDTDCQRTHPKSTITAHFTFCKKPWDCGDGNPGTVAFETCSGLLEEWYRVRRELEDWWLSPSTNNSTRHYWRNETLDKVRKSRLGSLDSATHLGYCDNYNKSGYRRLVEQDEL